MKTMQMQQARGFTLIEVMLVVAIVAVLGAIAVYGYGIYTTRARAADIVESFEATRTGAVSVVVADASGNCEDVLKRLDRKSLSQNYARLDYGFEAVAGGGYRPVLTVCAKADKQGSIGVEAARSAHDTLAKTGAIEKGALLGEAMVSFAVGLTPPTQPICRIPYGGSLTACGDPVAVPKPSTPATAQAPAQAAYPVPTPGVVAVPRCATVAAGPVDRKVMAFGPALTGHIMNNGDLNTGGDLREFTAEVAIVGGTQVAAAAGHGATILSYATKSQTNEFLIWNPTSLTIEFKNVDYDSHVNVNDGRNHRLTVTWQSASGDLILYDNGKEVWRATVNKGGVLGGNGKLVLGQDQDSYGGGFGTNDAYQGKIITASLASAAATGAQVGGGPIQTAFNAQNGLITNVVLDANGQPVDTTQRHTYAAGGSMTVSTEKVDTGLYVTADCK